MSASRLLSHLPFVVEIRHSIYRNLLLDPCLAYLSDKMEGVYFDYRKLCNETYFLGGEVFYDAAEFATKRHLAILRVNHQVYAEASSLMYSDLEMVLQPGDIMVFSHRLGSFK